MPEEIKKEEVKEEPEKEKPEASDENIDYKAELERLKEAKDKAENAAIKYKEIAQRKEKDYEQDELMLEEKIREMVRKETGKVIKEVGESQILSAVRKLSDNEDEQELMLYHYRNTISPTGDLEKDLKRAQLIANEGRIEKQMSELRRSILSKKGVSKGGGGAGQKTDFEGQRPKFSPQDEEMISQLKLVWDSKKQVFRAPSGREYPYIEGRGIVSPLGEIAARF